MIAMVLHSLNSLLSAYGTFSENRAVLIGSLVLRGQKNMEKLRLYEDNL